MEIKMYIKKRLAIMQQNNITTARESRSDDSKQSESVYSTSNYCIVRWFQHYALVRNQYYFNV